MLAQYFIFFAAFCFSGQVVASRERQMENLLQKPFWKALILKYPDSTIKDGDREIKVSEIFEADSNNIIVNEINVNDKIRQFHVLLSTIYGDLLHHFLSFLNIIKEEYGTNYNNNSNNELQSNCRDVLLELIKSNDKILWMIHSSLNCISSFYHVQNSPPINTTINYNIVKLKLTGLVRASQFFQCLLNIKLSLEVVLNSNLISVVNEREKTEDLFTMHNFAKLINRVNIPKEEKIKHYRDFIQEENSVFLKNFEEIGFKFNENTRLTSL